MNTPPPQQPIEYTETVHHRRHTDRNRDLEPLNLTSMLDVCFLLLVFFALTASFAIDEGVLSTELPDEGRGVSVDAPPPIEPIRIVLHPKDVDDVRIEVQAVHSQGPANSERLYLMLDSWRFNPETGAGLFDASNPVVIRVNGEVRWQHVVDVYNAVLRAQYTSVGIISNETDA